MEPDPRRKHPRFACDLPCRILLGEQAHEARVANVSIEGCYLESELLMDEGTHFVLEIEAGGPQPVVVEALLVHWRHLRDDADAAEPTMGYGVRLAPPTPAFWALVAEAEAGAS